MFKREKVPLEGSLARLLMALVVAVLLLLLFAVTLAASAASEGSRGSEIPSHFYQMQFSSLVELHGLRKGGCISSRYVITNLSSYDATTVHEFYNNQGQVVATEGDAIPPGEAHLYELSSIDSLPDGYEGYVIVAADQPITGVVLSSQCSIYIPLIVRNWPPSPGVYVLSNHSSFVDSIGYLHIVGEVWNNTASHLRFVKIAVNIFSSSGQLLDTDFTYTYLDKLPAGDKTCFHILLEEPAGWSYYEFESPTYWTDGEPLPNLAVFNDSGSYDSVYGWYEIVGQVRNDEGSRVEYVQPVGTLYNESGTVVGCDFTYVNSTHLDPAQTSSFKMTFVGRDYRDVVSYRLQVDGDAQ